jgi:hypothetical protein
MIYKIGKTNKVKNVATNNPPITTVANGFVLRLQPLLNAMGKNPNEATNAVIKLGVNEF